MSYLLLKLKFISNSYNGIESEFQCQINHGPEWNMEFSIPIQSPYKALTNDFRPFFVGYAHVFSREKGRLFIFLELFTCMYSHGPL